MATSMASTHNFPILSFLLLLNHSLSCLSSPSYDFDQWIAHNVRNHAKNRRNPTSIDASLRYAESNITRIIVGKIGYHVHFHSISHALASIPVHNSRRVILDIRPGIYREKIHIPKTMAFITFSGDRKNPPKITGNATASDLGKGGKPLSTFDSATVIVDGDYFVAKNMKFENTARHEEGVEGEQAVALRVSGTKASFHDCSFYGYQDTLYDHKGLHYFNRCFIQGSVDFIFGSGRSLYEDCTLNSLAKSTASLTAQKRTKRSISSGFSFKDCRVIGSGRVYLGRAWGQYSRVVFSYTYMGRLVLPKGWDNWGDPSRSRTVYYGEYRCSGPGANRGARVPWSRALTYEQAKPFLGTYYIGGDSWLLN